MAALEPSNTIGRQQSGAPGLPPYIGEPPENCAALPARQPQFHDYARLIILFSFIWAVCVGATIWGLR
jgi:hypothetical protein